ncbi:hypothetical protein I551_7221 [Mycobacterium ulcerans str. Harvey]|uniref:Uncharacterized protein n=1 Tax=Mycobacterium ulcerans str. Harvey TaxID=1299332 RepID=A0ABN0QNY7_MYCUL|nr:hypothetical protein I551_7221 [Mycobacterium ulcerans str. Harvey]
MVSPASAYASAEAISVTPAAIPTTTRDSRPVDRHRVAGSGWL